MDFNVDTGKPLLLTMAEIRAMRGQAVLGCSGLGSCIGVCALDPEKNIGGMAHVALPQAPAGKPVEKAGRFADTALTELIEQMSAMGASKERIRVAFAGGAYVARPGAESPPERTASAFLPGVIPCTTGSSGPELR